MNASFYSRHFFLEKVSEGIYAAIAKGGGGAAANAGFVDLGNQTIVFDTFNTQQAAEDLKKAAEEVTKHPVTWVINSHWHGDHIRGNQVFQKSAIVSSQITYEKMKEIHPLRINKQKGEIAGLSEYILSLENQLKAGYEKDVEQNLLYLKEIERSLPSLMLVLPQITFQDEMTFHGTSRKAKLFTWGGGHSNCDPILYVPEEKVIFMGDLLFVNTHPAMFEESNPMKWLEILQKSKGIDFYTAVPGHGPIGGKQNFIEVIEYIEGVMSRAGTMNSSAKEKEIPIKFQKWAYPEVFHKNVEITRQFLLSQMV